MKNFIKSKEIELKELTQTNKEKEKEFTIKKVNKTMWDKFLEFKSNNTEKEYRHLNKNPIKKS